MIEMSRSVADFALTDLGRGLMSALTSVFAARVPWLSSIDGEPGGTAAVLVEFLIDREQ
ncbi:MAG: hypothetical protein ACREER_08650 [Alphaproteobacteria bacterium]